MIQFYYSPNSCSISVHIALEVVGVSYEAHNVREMGDDFTAIHPKRSVPAMSVDGGEIMTQNEALLKYLAQKYPEAGIAGDGSLEQTYEINNWLSFVAGDLHPAHASFFGTASFTIRTDEESLDAIKIAGYERVKKQLTELEKGLEGKKFLLGEDMTIADMYAFPVSRWYHLFMKQSMDLFPNIVSYQERMSNNPAVAEVLRVHNP